MQAVPKLLLGRLTVIVEEALVQGWCFGGVLAKVILSPVDSFARGVRYSPKHHTLALYKAKQAIILLRDLFYFVLAYSRIMSTLSALSTALLGGLAYFSVHLPFCPLSITTRSKLLKSY